MDTTIGYDQNNNETSIIELILYLRGKCRNQLRCYVKTAYPGKYKYYPGKKTTVHVA